MKIGLFTELFPPSMGGQEQRFSELAHLLATRGHQVTVMCIRHSKEAAEEETLAGGVSVIRRPNLPNYYKPLGGLLPRSPLGMVRYALAVRRLTQAHTFDVIFMNQWPLLHVLALSRRDRARAVIDWCEIRRSFTFRFVQTQLPKFVAGNTTVSSEVARYIRRSAPDRVLVLPSGITSACYRAEPADARRGLLYVGRVTSHKNIPLLIETFEELCRRGYAEPLRIAGDGPAMEAVRRRVYGSPYAAKIDLLGFVSNERKYQLLAEARLLVMTSQREGFPRVVAEAMASSLPVLTARYRQNGTVGVVEEFGCGLCAEPVPADLANAAQTILHDWEPWSARARLPTSRLDWSALGQQFEAFLSETARGEILLDKTQGVSCESW